MALSPEGLEECLCGLAPGTTGRLHDHQPGAGLAGIHFVTGRRWRKGVAAGYRSLGPISIPINPRPQIGYHSGPIVTV
jgi:hypothetical protein